jgi:hydrogenase maturation protease
MQPAAVAAGCIVYNGELMRTLLIGYGNADRQDDGVAWYVLTGLARKLGRPIPDLPEDGFIPEGKEIDLWYVLQLVPEMSEEMSQYQRICFVDAHTGNIADEILLQPVDTSPASSAFTHHLTPAACLALTQTIYGKTPEARLLSIRGYKFGFARELSPETARLVEQAIGILWDWMAA